MLPSVGATREVLSILRQDPRVLAGTKPDHILTYVVEVTDRCNLRCLYCHQNLPGFQAQRDLNDETLQELVAYARKNRVGRIDLTGSGDLMQHPRWREIVAQLMDAGFQVVCTLNLSEILSEDDAALLTRFTVITVSLDTMDREVLNRVRKRVDVRTIMFNMARIKAAATRRGRPGPEWGASVVCYSESALRLPELVGFLISFGTKTLRIQDLVEIGGIQDNVTSFWALRGQEAFEAAKGLQEGLGLARAAGMDVYASEELKAGIDRIVARGPVIEAAPTAGRESPPAPGVGANRGGDPLAEPQSPAPQIVGAGSELFTATRRTYAPKPPKGMTRSCSDPWSLVMVHGDGATQACCFSAITYGSLGRDGTLDDLRNSAPARRLREQLLSGDLDEYCAGCNMRSLIPADRLRLTISRYMLRQQYPRVARVMVHVDRVTYYLVDLPHWFYWNRVRPRLARVKRFARAYLARA